MTTMMTTREAARALGISIKHLMTLIWEGKIEAIQDRTTRRWSLPARAIQARVKRRKSGT
jgi:excisionase family DNA binding protein